MPRRVAVVAITGLLVPLATGCGDTPHTEVVLDNDYSIDAAAPLVVYRGYWQAVLFDAAIPPGSSSDAMNTVPASDNTAYAVLAPGWDSTGAAAPTSLVVLQSRGGFAVHLNQTLHIRVDDMTFAGNCAAGNPLTQDQADFVTQFVFPSDFAMLRYDATTCAVAAGDAGAP